MSSTYSKIPDVIDYLVSNFTTAVHALDPTITVGDGFPGPEDGGQGLSRIIAVGGTINPVADGEDTPKVLGLRYLDEDFEIPITISSFTGDATDKPARDGAFALYDVAVGVLATDPTLGGIVRWCIPKKVSVKGSDGVTAAAGRTVTVTFSIRISDRVPFNPPA